MSDVSKAFADPAFIPHGYCISWDPGLVALHVGSDGIIALSYYSIPIALLYFALRRRETSYNWVLWLFASFILACGTTHLLAIYTLWVPAYWADGIVKALTASISVVTATLLWPLVPKVLALPTPSDLRQANVVLTQQIAEKERLQTQLQEHEAHLEHLVDERTAALQQTAANLTREIEERETEEGRRLELERKMQQAQKLESLGILAGGIAHDFNNLLTVMLGHAELMLNTMPSGDPNLEHATQVHRAAISAAGLTRQMLDYAGKGRYELREIPLNDTLLEITQLLSASTPKKTELRLSLGPELPVILADGAQLHQVILNLITNAAEAIGDVGGVIELSTGCVEASAEYLASCTCGEPLPAGRYAYVQVADTGCGMDSATMARIFEPFFTTKFTGRGLGLSAMQGIVRAHHGAIHLESTAGKGSIFRVLFPAAHGQIQLPETVAAGLRGSGDWILVVDDDENVRNTVQLMLESLGFRVVTASDGRTGVDVFISHPDPIAAVLLDYTMPRMNGEETMLALRVIEPRVPVILYSGYSEQAIAQKYQTHQPIAFLQKPFQFERLRARLAQALRGGNAGGSSPQARAASS